MISLLQRDNVTLRNKRPSLIVAQSGGGVMMTISESVDISIDIQATNGR